MASVKNYIAREPNRNLTAWLALLGGVLILLLSLPIFEWKWATGAPGILIGSGCLLLGIAELLPKSGAIVLAACLRVTGYLFILVMVFYVLQRVGT